MQTRKEKFLQSFQEANGAHLLYFFFAGEKATGTVWQKQKQRNIFLWFCEFFFDRTRKICCFFVSIWSFEGVEMETFLCFLFVFLTTTSDFLRSCPCMHLLVWGIGESNGYNSQSKASLPCSKLDFWLFCFFWGQLTQINWEKVVLISCCLQLENIIFSSSREQ